MKSESARRAMGNLMVVLCVSVGIAGSHLLARGLGSVFFDRDDGSRYGSGLCVCG